MSLKRDMVWKVEESDFIGDKIRVTGYIQYSSAIVLEKPTVLNLEFAKEHIYNELKSKCFESGYYSREKQEIYMRGYIDAMNGFNPKTAEEEK